MKNYFENLNVGITRPVYEAYGRKKNEVLLFEKNYKDPDAHSDELYNELAELCKKYAVNRNPLSIKYNEEIFLRSDYIGPSRAKALKAGLSGYEIFDFLHKTRQIGGHMLWPKHNSKRRVTINTIRASSRYEDRFDLMLYGLREWYVGNEEKLKNKALVDELNYKDGINERWLNHFGTGRTGLDKFKKFVNFFQLKSFCDEDYNIHDLTTFDESAGKFISILENDLGRVPKDYDGFKTYVAGSVHCIEERTKALGARGLK
ncbi:hypothetical protein NGC82_15760 [Enterococcus casseliflavus]|nr:hypothetical protein [Enterococcus casseliflavus]